jgi:hypothetical protein
MNPIKRFEDAINTVRTAKLEQPQKEKSLSRIRKAIDSYRKRLNQLYLASKNSWERSMLREAGNRLRMLDEEIRILTEQGPNPA